MTKIAFYGTKSYDKIWFEPLAKEYDYQIRFIEGRLNEDTLPLSEGCLAVCTFVNNPITKTEIDGLNRMGVKVLLLRSAGYNHVDLKAAKGKLIVLRVPGYSPQAVAEFATGLLLSLNRRIHRAYVRTREFNMSIQGLMGRDLHGKIAGVIGTGRIGQAMISILQGFGMEILAYDMHPADLPGVTYVKMDELLARSDVVTLHCPLTKDTYHLIDKKALKKMKRGAYLINTSRGALVNAVDLMEELKSGHLGGVGLDVYEEEDGVFYEDHSNQPVEDDVLARLMSFPNVLITSHQGFFTEEAVRAIAITTLENLRMYERGLPLVNQVIS
ncbi:MAG: 2-hydroxyacid dehydrogenase [Lachnospiraceae bacterium]|nr:2-hydroxyacid dehydrogenase [Lachnospiraceae bacterium]